MQMQKYVNIMQKTKFFTCFYVINLETTWKLAEKECSEINKLETRI